MPKTERIDIRIAHRWKEAVKELAAAEGLSVSKYIEDLIIHSVALDYRNRKNIESEIEEKAPNISKIEKAILLNEQLQMRKQTVRNLDAVALMRMDAEQEKGE